MKYMDGDIKDEYVHPKRVGYPQEFYSLIAKEGGESIKIKTFQKHIEASYQDLSKGNKSLSERDYQKALGYFTAAFKLKPRKKEPAKTIEKINSIMSFIEELHKIQFNN